MSYDADFISRLIDASALIERHKSLDDAMGELAKMTAQLLSAERSSIMLLGEDEARDDIPAEATLRVYAHYGTMPKVAYEVATRINEGVSGHVAATGEPLLIPDIAQSSFAGKSRRRSGRGGSLISVPIRLGGKIIGVINVSNRTGGGSFTTRDLDLLNVFSMFMGQSIHVAQLQNVLRSRFLQLALALEHKSGGSRDTPLSPDPVHLAKIVAKTIYRNSRRAGSVPARSWGWPPR
ncbi:GAF domain-containing protein [Acidihalobacter prosperus]|uniref:GAF domain-containing protein n=1 Tax=Acidihalobacter prosperus TaxID=160660 RepID=A0A1A6C7P0_9GAMM|nr:GAF domain-containing protein [Acidihalobacter prosperus]OBS10583.1 hypothetical protein Thpro_020299 [Acidihalobacter prosperus]